MTMLDLETRPGLPEPLRLVLAQYPRADWTLHRNFDGLVRFWLERHLAFRAMTAEMAAQTRALLDGNFDPRNFAAGLAQRGNQFVEHLHGHHQIEDAHFFPQLAVMEPGLAKGFDLLDSDHLAIDRHLSGFVTAANLLLGNWQNARDLPTAAAGFLGEVGNLTRLLDRHLTDEEELVVPTILRHGSGRLS